MYHQRCTSPDAYVPKRVHVTERDFDAGLKGISYCCPVALALKRLLKPGTMVQVYGSYVNLRDSNDPVHWETSLPSWPVKWIKRYDDYVHIPSFPRSFTFLVDLPVPLLRSAAPASLRNSDDYRVRELLEIR